MRQFGIRMALCGALALAMAGAFAGCENPLDPINKSEKIQGLSYVDFSPSWERWDSDPEYDGLAITVNYYNEFGEGLSFHDKPHEVVFEFWTSRDTEDVSTGSSTGTSTGTKAARSRIGLPSRLIVQEKLWFSKTINFSNSDDVVRIPVEAYSRYLPACKVEATPSTGTGAVKPKAPNECDQTGFMVMRVFPPQGYPRNELVVAQTEVTFFKPVLAQETPNQ